VSGVAIDGIVTDGEPKATRHTCDQYADAMMQSVSPPKCLVGRRQAGKIDGHFWIRTLAALEGRRAYRTIRLDEVRCEAAIQLIAIGDDFDIDVQLGPQHPSYEGDDRR